MSAPCEDLARILNGYGDLVLGTNLFGFELGFNGDAEIDKQLAILDTGTASVDSYPIYEHPTIQLFFRGERAQRGKDVFDWADPILKHILSLPETDQNGSGYAVFRPLNGLNPLGRDENGRFIYTANIYTFRTEV